MNVGGVPKVCKSNDPLDPDTSVDGTFLDSGKRVSNALVTYLEVRDSHPKGWLIPDSPNISHVKFGKAPAFREGPASYQLVGEVKAHQGEDG